MQGWYPLRNLERTTYSRWGHSVHSESSKERRAPARCLHLDRRSLPDAVARGTDLSRLVDRHVPPIGSCARRIGGIEALGTREANESDRSASRVPFLLRGAGPCMCAAALRGVVLALGESFTFAVERDVGAGR